MLNINICTKIIEIYSENDLKKIEEVVRFLYFSKIVALPTETVYGLGADIRNEEAVKKIYIAKNRPFDNPLILHVSNINMAKTLMDNEFIHKDIFLKLAQKFWPGELTIIVKKNKETVSNFISRDLDSIAIRIPRNKIFLKIIEMLNSPIAAPSANLSSLPSPTKFEHVYNDLNTKVDAIVRSFDCRVGVESTVISLLQEKPVIVRPGFIKQYDIEKVIGKIDVCFDGENKNDKIISPGLKYKHYAPKTKFFLFDGSLENFKIFLNNKNNVCAFLFNGEEKEILIKNKIILGNYTDENEMCKNLYTSLRKLDSLNVDVCYLRIDEKIKNYTTFFNRILKASGFSIINE